jgi:hypothetical protein
MEKLVGDIKEELLDGLSLLELLTKCSDLVDDGCQPGDKVIN